MSYPSFAGVKSLKGRQGDLLLPLPLHRLLRLALAGTLPQTLQALRALGLEGQGSRKKGHQLAPYFLVHYLALEGVIRV